jgi:iron complex transport system permease protein
MERSNKRGRFSYPSIIWGLGIALIVIIILSFFLGRYPITPSQLFGILFSKIFPINQFWLDQMETIVFNVRLPRIMLTVAIVYFVSKNAKGSKLLGLILSGIIVSSLFAAGTSYIKLVADPNDQLPAITYWLMGSLSGATRRTVALVLIPMVVGLIPLFLMRWRINVLTLGDEEARTMGINATRLRLFIITFATLVTAASVSVSGMIGWVGLVVPHLARRLVGNNYRHLMPASMLAGAVFMLIVDNVSRNLLQTEIPIGILTAFVGAPFFVYLITRRGEVY